MNRSFCGSGTRRARELCPSSPVFLADVGELERQGLLMVGRARPIEEYVRIRFVVPKVGPRDQRWKGLYCSVEVDSQNV